MAQPDPKRDRPYFLRHRYSSNNTWGIPTLKRNTTLSLKHLGVIRYDNTRCKDKRSTNKIVHFFIDDDKFENTYYQPEGCLRKLAQYKHVLTPDFSLYTDMPLAIQLFNTFRNRWCGAFWQELGLSVLPTITWGNKESFDFCFKGVPKGSVVAISTIGCKHCKEAFMLGYNEMLNQITPELILCFDMPFPEMDGNVIYIKTNRFPQKKKKESTIWEEEELIQGTLDLNRWTSI
jgi:hypothetical protein